MSTRRSAIPNGRLELGYTGCYSCPWGGCGYAFRDKDGRGKPLGQLRCTEAIPVAAGDRRQTGENVGRVAPASRLDAQRAPGPFSDANLWFQGSRRPLSSDARRPHRGGHRRGLERLRQAAEFTARPHEPGRLPLDARWATPSPTAGATSSRTSSARPRRTTTTAPSAASATRPSITAAVRVAGTFPARTSLPASCVSPHPTSARRTSAAPAPRPS